MAHWPFRTSSCMWFKTHPTHPYDSWPTLPTHMIHDPPYPRIWFMAHLPFRTSSCMWFMTNPTHPYDSWPTYPPIWFMAHSSFLTSSCMWFMAHLPTHMIHDPPTHPYDSWPTYPSVHRLNCMWFKTHRTHPYDSWPTLPTHIRTSSCMWFMTHLPTHMIHGPLTLPYIVLYVLSISSLWLLSCRTRTSIISSSSVPAKSISNIQLAMQLQGVHAGLIDHAVARCAPRVNWPCSCKVCTQGGLNTITPGAWVVYIFIFPG